MKNIEVLLATSSDLDNDNLYFGDLIDQLNDIFKSRGINLNLVEHIDSGELESSPADLDAKLAGCEMCMVLHSNDINKARKEEFSKVYDEFMQGRNPRKIYVFFKDVAEEDLSESMKDFKRGFVNNFGHFYGVYENVDTLRLQFLLQFELYQNKGFGEKILTVKNEKVQIYENDIVDLNNIAFARDNEKFKELKAQISELSKKISQKRKEFALDPENDAIFDEISTLLKDKRELEDEYNAHQGFLFDMSLAFSKLATKELNETTKQAMELFKKGFSDAANKLLDEEKMNADAENMLNKRAGLVEMLEENDNEIKAQINAFLAKTKTVMAVSYLSIEERLRSAYSAYGSAIKLAEKIDYDKEELVGIYIGYAVLLHIYANYDKALEYYEKVLIIQKESFGERHPNVAVTYSNIGSVYISKGVDDKALEYQQVALDILENGLLIEYSLCKAGIYSNIGTIYCRQGNYEKALVEYKKALDIQEGVLGKEHIETSISYNCIGTIHSNQRDYEKALEYDEKALGIQEDVLGKEHIETARSYNGIGTIYANQGDYEKALGFYEKALDIRKKALGRNPETAESYYCIGALYHNQGDCDRALDFYKKALDIQEKMLGKESLDTLITYNGMATIYLNSDEKEKALEFANYFLEIMDRCLEIRENVLGKGYEENLIFYRNTARLYYEKDEFDKSERYFGVVIEKCEVLLKSDSLNIKEYEFSLAMSYAYLGVIYRKRAIYVNSEEYSMKALDLQEALYIGDLDNIEYKDELSSTYHDLAKLYEVMGNPEKSEFYKKKALSLYENA